MFDVGKRPRKWLGLAFLLLVLLQLLVLTLVYREA